MNSLQKILLHICKGRQHPGYEYLTANTEDLIKAKEALIVLGYIKEETFCFLTEEGAKFMEQNGLE